MENLMLIDSLWETKKYYPEYDEDYDDYCDNQYWQANNY